MEKGNLSDSGCIRMEACLVHQSNCVCLVGIRIGTYQLVQIK